MSELEQWGEGLQKATNTLQGNNIILKAFPLLQ